MVLTFSDFWEDWRYFYTACSLWAKACSVPQARSCKKLLEKLTGVLPVAVALGAVVTRYFAVEQCHNGNDGWFCKRRADEFKAGLRRCNGCQYRHHHDGTAYCL